MPRGSGKNVVLNWVASTTSGVTYNVYRIVEACTTANPFTRINASPVAALTYTDPDVPTGTICYYVTSYLQSASTPESVPSNKAEVTIIVQPNPPQNLQITPPAVTMQLGTSQQFTATDQTATWFIDPPDLGSISQTGFYTAPASIKGNNVKVTVQAHSGLQTATAQVTLRK